MRNLIFALSLIFILYSCKDNTTNPSTQSPSDYYPLSVGNEWTYSFFYRHSSKEEGLTTFTVNLTKRIIGTKQFDGKDYYTIENVLWRENVPDQEKDTMYTRIDNGKIYQKNNDSEKEFLFSDLSLPVGGTFISIPENTQPALFMLKDKNTKLSLPTLSFDKTYFFENVDNGQSDSTYISKITMYYAPGVGLARLEVTDKTISSKDDYDENYSLEELKYAKINGKEYGNK